MLRADDIAEAVDAGLISEAQARGLEALAANRRKARVFAVGREERFKLLGGFNDFFVALGVLLLGFGIQFAPFTLAEQGRLGRVRLGAGEALSFELVVVWAVGLLLFWGLAEYLTGRLKLVAPSIVIVVFLAIFAGMAGSGLTGSATGGYAAAVAIAGLHYARFRLPFSLFVLAFIGVVLATSLVSTGLANGLGVPVQDVGMLVKWTVFGFGLATFAWAMSFDVSDRERTSRRADCGFWLHLLAAPLIVHPLAGPLINHPLFPDYSGRAPVVTGVTVAMVVGLIGALSVVALIVDRRALLVAGLGYLGTALAYTITAVSGASQAIAVLPTLVVLGLLIIVLGVAWREVRSGVMGLLPDGRWKAALPPYGRLR
jgi:hypothetical protein